MSQTLDIATASSRTQLVWQNEQITWEKLVRKLSSTHRTAESFASYISAAKPRQAEIKDIGGFVGGYLLEGRRAKGYVKYRQLIALDIDNGYPDLWEDYLCFFKNASCVYSTHAHSMVQPRFRIIIPLDRPVSPEEYEAISRKIGSVIGLKYLDRTTFQAERLMFWPSTSKDGDFYFREQSGPWLKADDILNEYRDWRNHSEWPLCPTETEIIRSELKRQTDPNEKEGVIGAFCRVYPISRAISTFIPDDYAPAGEDRYTYSGGTTAAGAVCYEDKFLFSHHSTDPGSGQLLNSFDLIRIHKFEGDFSKMSHLATTDPEVIQDLGIFKLKDSGLSVGDDVDWLSQMEVDKKGNYMPTINNFLLVMRNDINLKGRFSMNEFDQLIYVNGKEAKDEDESTLRHYFEVNYGLYHSAKAKDAFNMGCKDNSFHPIKDYLNSITWDGVERLDRLFIDQLGVVDTPYTRAVTRKALVAAVARVMNPGCKFDYMIVAIGPQGKGKSSLLYDLGKQWFSDTLDSVTGKDAYIQLQGAWLMEIAELSSIKKAEVEAVKKFLTKQKDRYRPPFGKHNVEVQRQIVFFGSTNEHTFLIDKTGNRRFWPLVVNKKYTPGSINPDPIWAEALVRYNEGELLFLSEELEAMAAEQQSNHTEQDDRTGLIEKYLGLLLPAEWEDMSVWQRVAYVNSGGESGAEKGTVSRERVCSAEIWCELFGNKFSDMDTYKTKFIHNIMLSMSGWQKGGTMHYKKYGSQRSYVRTDVAETVEEVISQEELI